MLGFSLERSVCVAYKAKLSFSFSLGLSGGLVSENVAVSGIRRRARSEFLETGRLPRNNQPSSAEMILNPR
jgi:hypothetical protein